MKKAYKQLSSHLLEEEEQEALQLFCVQTLGSLAETKEWLTKEKEGILR